MQYPTEFLHPKNAAGQTILKLVSRGSSIMAEMNRLSDHVPGVFTNEDPNEAKKYSKIIMTFEYFKNRDKYDNAIDNDELLMDLDDEFRQNHEEIVSRFYELFESIVRYHTDLLTFIQSLKDGAFLQYSFELLINDIDGCQLISEAIYLYGVMLLMLDIRIPGPIREKMIVATYKTLFIKFIKNKKNTIQII